MSFSRRTLLGASVAGLGASAFGVTTPQRRGRRPKNIIFCVADGMATSTVTMADHFLQLRDGKRSYLSTLMDRPEVVRGWQDTRSLNSVVTDSSAAASTWGCGRRIWNGQVNVFPDGTELRTLTSLMVEAGVKCGLVTTTTITHATPSGFALNCPDRGMEALLAEKYLKSGVDVLMGGGDNVFNPKTRKDGRDLYADFAKAGYTVVKTRDELMANKAKKVLGIFTPSHLPFTVDRDNSPELQRTTPSLAELVRSATERLKGSPKGFLLQVEGGKVDHGAHANDLAAMMYDQIAFEEAVKAAIEFAEKDGETLVIVTADHATGGPALNGAGSSYGDSTPGLLTLANMKSSYDPIFSALGKTPSAKEVQDVIEAKLGIKLAAAEGEGIASAIKGQSPFPLASFMSGRNGSVATILGNHSKVTWTSGNHTSDHVMVIAFGPGSEQIKGVTPNTTFFDLMTQFKGIKWSNPTMTFEEAKRHRASAVLDPEWIAYYSPDRDEPHWQ
jgi:alkaline phosphatase